MMAEAHDQSKPWKKPRKGPFALYASDMLANGYSPVLIIPGTKRPWGRGEGGKGWDQLRSTPYTPEQIEEDVAKYTSYGIGAIGGFNGLVPLEFDTDDADIIAAGCSVLPRPVVAKRGRKGYTAFYRAPDGWEPETKRFTPSGGGAPLVEILGKGKTVIPPTIHPDLQRPYEWLTPDATLFNVPISELPQLTDDFMEALAYVLKQWCPEKEIKFELRAISSSDVPSHRMEAYARETLEKRVGELSGMSGGRNPFLYKTVCRVGNWVHHGYLPESEMISSLRGAYEKCGAMKEHGRNAFVSSIKSGMRTSANDPLWAPQDFSAITSTPDISKMVDKLVAAAEAKAAKPGHQEVEATNVIPLMPAKPVSIDDVVFDEDFSIAVPPSIIPNWLPRNGLVVDGGQSGAGKTYVEVDQAVAIASGQTFFGQPVDERLGVAYLAAEGQATIQRRFIAAKRKRGLEGIALPLTVLPKIGSLRDAKERATLIVKLKKVNELFIGKHGVPLGVIILDTVSSACPMKNDDNAEIAHVCNELRQIGDMLNSVFIAIHHFGKNQDAGLRGGSNWRALCDHSRIMLMDKEKAGDVPKNRRMSLEKNRMGPEGETIGYDLAATSFGVDEKGRDIKECHIETKDAPVAAVKVSKDMAHFFKAFDFVSHSYRHDGNEFGLRPNMMALPLDIVRQRFEDTWASGQESLTPKQQAARRSAWNRAMKAARKSDFTFNVINWIEWVWPASMGIEE